MAVYLYIFWTQYCLIAFPMTWNLSKINTWKSKEEPFFTNCSLFNAFVTWLFWIINMFCIYLLMFYGIILLVAGIVLTFKQGPTTVVGYVWKGFKIVFAMLWASITNKSATEAILR
jgi:hypothetical protein